MLYDQAQLLSVYARAYQITKQESYATVVKDIVHYVSRDLHHKDGAFYAAEDADSLPNDQATKKLGMKPLYIFVLLDKKKEGWMSYCEGM